MTDLNISFFNCAQALRRDQISVKPAAAAEEKSISIRESVQTAYIYMEKAALRLLRWITVTAAWFRRAVTGRVRAFVRSAVCTSGVQILHNCAILRI